MEDFKLKYERLEAKVKQLREWQKKYFATRDHKTLIISKSIEKELDEMVNPKPKAQAEIDWLGQ